MQIDLNVLEKSVITILKYLKENYSNNMELDEDYYWHLSSESIYDVVNEPTELTLGSLVEDYEFLCPHQKTGDLSGHDLKYISTIMRYLSIKFSGKFCGNDES